MIWGYHHLRKHPSGKHTNKKHHHWFTKKTAPKERPDELQVLCFFCLYEVWSRTSKFQATHSRSTSIRTGTSSLVWIRNKKGYVLKFVPKWMGLKECHKKGPETTMAPRNYYEITRPLLPFLIIWRGSGRIIPVSKWLVTPYIYI